MDNQTIQDKIITSFKNAIMDTAKFTEDEIKDIVAIISSSQKAEKMVESILKSIGGTGQ